MYFCEINQGLADAWFCQELVYFEMSHLGLV